MLCCAVQEAAQEAAWPADVAVERRALLARADDLCSSFSLLLSQCFVDAPHLMRHLRLLSSASSLLQSEVRTQP